MKPLDDPDFFKYSANRQRKSISGKQQSISLVNCYVNVYLYNNTTRENQPQGQFIFALQTAQPLPLLTVYKQGATPLLSFNIFKTMSWTLQNSVYCYFTDPSNRRWTVQFNDPQEAAHATAEIGFLFSYTNPKDIAIYEATQQKDPRILNRGDKMKISWFCYGIESGHIGKIISSKEGAKMTFDHDKLPVGMETGINGMTVNSSRVIFVPQIYSPLQNGTSDPKFPNQNLIIVATLLAVRHADSHETSEGQSDSPELPQHQSPPPEPIRRKSIPVPTEVPPPIQIDPEVVQKSETSEISERSESERGEDADPETERQNRLREKMMKTGAVAINPFAMKPKSDAASGKVASLIGKLAQESERSVSDTSDSPSEPKPKPAEPKPKPTESKPKASEPKSSSPADLKFKSSDDILQRLSSIEEKLEMLTKPTDVEPELLIRGVQNLSVQLRVKQSEIDSLKKAAASVPPPVKEPPVSAVINRQLDNAVKEAEDLRRKLDAAERKIKELEKKPSSSGSLTPQKEAEIKSKAEAIIKKMMGDVYNDAVDEFPDGQKFDGQVVADKLFQLLRKRSFEAFNDIKAHGLV